MKPQNPTAFPAEVFIAAGVPRNAEIRLTVSGLFFSYGVIKRRYLTNEFPDKPRSAKPTLSAIHYHENVSNRKHHKSHSMR